MYITYRITIMIWFRRIWYLLLLQNIQKIVELDKNMKLYETNSIELFKEAHILTRPRLTENIHRQFMYSLCGLFVHVCNCYICVSLVAICNLLRPVVSVTTNQYSTLQLIMIYHLRLYFDAHFWQPIIIKYCRSFFFLSL